MVTQKAKDDGVVPKPHLTVTHVPVIRQLRIERFRGIKQLNWHPAAGLNVVLGGGNAGKTTILEAIGLPLTFRQATEMASDGGRCVMIGIAAAGRLGEVEIARLVRRKLQVLGSYGGRPRSDLGELTALAVRGEIDPGAAISRRYSLDQAGEAYAALARGEIVGRALVEM